MSFMMGYESGLVNYTLFEESFSMFLLFDERGTVFRWNTVAKRQLGYEDAVDEVPVYITDIFRREFKREDGRVLAGCAGKVMDSFAYRKNQTCFPVHLRITIVKEEQNWVGICEAVNTTKQVEAIKSAQKVMSEVKQLSNVQSEFVSNVTHELRTPVNGIKGTASQLRETPLSQEQGNMLDIIDRCCDNMSHIINDLLDFSKMESGKFTLIEERFNLRECIRQSVQANLPMVHGRGLILRLNIAKDVPEYVIGDSLRITQILNNLLSNSIKFTSVGQILVDITKTMEQENELELFFMVSDTGIGIDKGDMDKLFKSFSQVDASITRRYGGTGLGLSITKSLIEMMKGNIEVESEKGTGSTFSFNIRLRRAEADEDAFEYAREESSFIYGDEEKEGYDIKEVFQFGTEANKKEINNMLDKIILCIEMENWERAEEFTNILKSLVEKEEGLKRSVFKLELSIRKEMKDKSLELYEIAKKNIMKILEHL